MIVNESCTLPNTYVWNMRMNLGTNGLDGFSLCTMQKSQDVYHGVHNVRDYLKLLAFTASLVIVVVASCKIKAIV